MIHHRMHYYFRTRKESGKRGGALWKKVIHDVFSEIVGSLFELFCRLHICKPYVMVRMDGGICSQMNQYLLGQIFAQQGEQVCYDLTWFVKYGMDVDRRFVRTFELEEMFPDIHIESSGRFRTWFYHTFLSHASVDQRLPEYDKGIAPVYLDGYYSNIEDSVFAKQFDFLFCAAKKAYIPCTLNRGNSDQHTCAIHVRRGDLARGDNPYYGGVTDEYFFRAIAYVEHLFPKTKFFFFSDEIEYVKENLAPRLDVDFELITELHKAYEDLLLISECDTIVASQGSFGKFAAMLNKDSMLVLQDDEYAKPWVARKQNSVVL